MPLSWNEIKHRAIKFGNDWKTETRESAERQTFWNEFFDVFGIKIRTVASFEEPVKHIYDYDSDPHAPHDHRSFQPQPVSGRRQ